jgi:hypothetical protein
MRSNRGDGGHSVGHVPPSIRNPRFRQQRERESLSATDVEQRAAGR